MQSSWGHIFLSAYFYELEWDDTQKLLLYAIYCEDNCQNPNLTTSQPKPNLNLVGFDTIITLHHPTTHPTTGTLSLPQGMVLEV